MNPTSAPQSVDQTPGPKPASAAPPGVGADGFAAILAALASLGPPPTPGPEAQAARTAPAEGTEAGSDSPGSTQITGVPLGPLRTTTAVGEPGIFAPIDAPEEPSAEDGDAPVTVDDPSGAAASAPVSGKRVLDSENPAAIAYARMRLDQLVRAGVIEEVPAGDPTAAWRELSKNIAAIAQSAGYKDPREFLAHGHVDAKPSPAPAGASASPAKGRQGAEIPIEVHPLQLDDPQSLDSRTYVDRVSLAFGDGDRSEEVRGRPTVEGAAAAGRSGPALTDTPAPNARPDGSTVSAPAVGQQTIRADADAGAPEAPAPAPVTARLHELAEKTQATIRVAVRARHTDARIILRPPELGEVRITLRYEGSGVSALLTADSGKAVELLAQASADLRRSLEQQGVTVQSLDVKLGGDHGRREAGPWQDGRTAPAHRLAFDDDDSQPTTEPVAPIAHDGQIDLLA